MHMATQHPQHRRRRRRRRSRLPLLLKILVLAVFAALFLRWSNTSLQVEEFTYSSQHLPAGFDGCTIVQLSDLHGAEFGENNRKLLQAVLDADPDYIFLTGDLQDRFRETPQSYAFDLCQRLQAIAPTYYVTGNHEWALPNIRDLKSGIAETGVTVLTNTFVTLERNGDSILLAGIDDPNGFADQKTPEELAEEVQATWGDNFWMLLAHRNNYFEKRYSLLGADLVLSGHAHGGIIRLPFTDGLLGVERNFFPSYTAGFYEDNGADLFVSRGLGNSGRSFRLFNRPQLVVMTLDCEE